MLWTLMLLSGLQTINGLKHVESSAMLQFLQPTLNMLLRMIGDGGETLQVLWIVKLPGLLTFCYLEPFTSSCYG